MGFRVWGLGFGVLGFGFRVSVVEFGIWGLGAAFLDLGLGVWGLGFGVWGLGFGAWGLGCTPRRIRIGAFALLLVVVLHLLEPIQSRTPSMVSPQSKNEKALPLSLRCIGASGETYPCRMAGVTLHSHVHYKVI